ncbi:MAG: extracellular solute-binding protein [Hamadaea sp.]|uniref:vWA domain-containing protein n=1 Tax=Hamadaea sp. TaxID=2024425 RepID=UPI00185593FC|nr:extracellular solute-binding protein [Hamadaea sp.]NUR71697.1 extracellular solute-binding protein [Hamadaea sp.]NUT24261.1 extracellular solute-binding protein [Hamadaea sp.]
MASGRTSARRWLPVVIAVTVGIAVIAGSSLYVRSHGDRGDCVALDVVASTEKNKLVGEIADRYNHSGRRFGGHCAAVTVAGLTSGQAMEALAGDWAEVAGSAIPKPQVWLPTSSLWTGQLRLRDQAAKRPEQTPGEYPSIANSPLVIAMPATKARVLQQRGALGWGDILGLSGDAGWGAFGRPDWKRFTFGKDNPRLSTSGLAATIATYYAATGTSSDLTDADVRDPRVTQFVRRIEANVSHYSDDVVDLLKSLAAADLSTVDDSRPDVSAIVTQEELVFLYNEGQLSPRVGDKPHEPLVALYPKEGTFNLDHPYVVLPNASSAQRQAAADFLAYLQAAPQQKAFAGLGFRDHQQVASAELKAVVGGHETAERHYFAPPSPAVVQQILESWGTLRKKANILMAVDVSGSMSNKVGSKTRLDVAMSAAKNGLSLLNSADQVGLWSFSSEKQGSGRAPYQEQVPLSPLDLPRFADRLGGLRAGGATALYTTIRAAHRYMLDHYDRTRINAVVVLTDGENEYAKDDNLARLLEDIALDPERPVKIFCIAFDTNSDFPTLTAVAKATSGKAFDARKPELIDDAFVKLLSSF